MAVGAAVSIAVAMLAWGGSTAATAQDSSRGILGLGNAVVTGFSGVRPPAAPPRVDPIEKTFIDLDRPSARVINLEALRGPPQGQLVPAPKPFSVTAAQVGQVFSIALDDATPPNIYLAATSAYGLPIVVPDRDGDGLPDRSRRGGPNANFMPGLFGPVTANGGPGSIWRIDGRTGAVALFANVTLDRVANSGPALGGLAFDPATRQLFVADRDTGMIHRFGLDGADRGRFDHGVSGRPAVKLNAVPFDPRKRLDLTSPAFDSGNPATWAYAPPERRIFGLAVRGGRLFYAVAAGLQVWSVAIAQNGGFGSDPRLELDVPAGQSVAEISNIVFDEDGRMIVAERGAPTGAYDYKALAQSGENRVLRFRLKLPGDPPGPGLWHPTPEEYAIGFAPNLRNGNGGIAIGYGSDAGGKLNRAACGGTLWSTGEQLRNARAPAIAQRLAPGGALIVDGLQGNAIGLARPQNEPPFAAYYIDYDDRFDDAAARGHLGDVEIWRLCQAVALACPPGTFNVGGACLFALACPAGTEFADGRCVYRDCPPSYVRIGGNCVPPPQNCKPNETYWGGGCQPPKCRPGLDQADEDGKVGCPKQQWWEWPKHQCPSPDKGGEKSGGAYCKCPAGQEPGKDGSCGPIGDCTPIRQLRGECVPTPAAGDCPWWRINCSPDTPSPAAGDCPWWRINCSPDTQLPTFTPFCPAPKIRKCCSDTNLLCVPRPIGACPPNRPVETCVEPETPDNTPGQLLGVCPYSMVGGTCCDGKYAVTCNNYSNLGCPTNWTPQGGGVCCSRLSDRDNFCATPTQPTATGSGGWWCWIPIAGWIGCTVDALTAARTAPQTQCIFCRAGEQYCNPEGFCTSDPPASGECRVGGVCRPQPVTGFSVPSVCTAEAAAAGACSPPPPPPTTGGCKTGETPSRDGKTCCDPHDEFPPEACKTQPVQAKTYKKKKETACDKGFHPDERGRCVQNVQPQSSPGFNIGIGIGGGGGGRGGGSRGGGNRGGGGNRPCGQGGAC